MKHKLIAFSVAALILSGSAFAQQALKAEDAIKYRKAGYAYMGWSMGKIKANLDGSYDKGQVIQAANTIAALANSGMGALYVPGSEQSTPLVATKLVPDFTQKQQGLGKLAQTFNQEANELAKIAATGDAGAVKAQFSKVGAACKACHDEFRLK